MKAVDVTRWTRTTAADGTIVLTAPPVHPGFARERHAQLRIRRGQPLVRLADTVDRFVTRSGEYGTLHAERVTIEGRLVHRAIASVLGDEQLTLEGFAESSNIVTLVRDLAVECTWLAAPDRIRMVPYRPPTGWFGVRRELATIWLPPGAPRNPATLVVGDAVPRGPAERTFAAVWPMVPPAGTERTTLDGTALPTTIATWTEADQRYALADLADLRWHIRLALRAGSDADLALLHDLARSIEPVPPVASIPFARSELQGWM